MSSWAAPVQVRLTLISAAQVFTDCRLKELSASSHMCIFSLCMQFVVLPTHSNRMQRNKTVSASAIASAILTDMLQFWSCSSAFLLAQNADWPALCSAISTSLFVTVRCISTSFNPLLISASREMDFEAWQLAEVIGACVELYSSASQDRFAKVLHLVVLCALAADVAGTDTNRLIMICTQVLAANYLTPALARNLTSKQMQLSHCACFRSYAHRLPQYLSQTY